MSTFSEGPIRSASRISARELAPLLGEWRSSAGGVSGYRSLAERIKLLVLEGRLPVGTVLPSERSLATTLDTSRTTTTAAFGLLREEGFALSSQGAGTWTTLPSGQRRPGEPSPTWPPVSSDGERPPPGGVGDFASAATEAPAQLFAAYQQALTEMPHYLPGNGYVAAGLPVLRARIAERYTARGLPTVPEQVLITNGALHALHLVLSVIMQRGDRVLIEHPTYPAAADAVATRGGRGVPLPIEDGWDVARAEALLRQTGAQLAYLMIDFQNPTGRLLEAPGRSDLADSLCRTGCTAIVDETMVDLDLRADLGLATGPMPPPLPSYLNADQVICLGSAGKTLWGGLRIGWIRASQPTVRRLTLARANDDLGGPILEQLAAAHLFADLQPLLRERRATIAERCRTLRAALAQELPEWVVPLPQGGFSLWVHLPEPRCTRLSAAARTLGVRITPGPRFGLDGAFETRLRLPFARPSEDLAAMAVVLARAWRSRDGAHPALDDDLTTV